MKSWIMAVLCIATVVSPVAAQENELGESYIANLTRLWEEDATPQDVDELGTLLAPGAVYAHPRVGAEIAGRREIVTALSSFLGTTREPRVANLEVIVGEGVVAIGFDLSMETRSADGWQPVNRRHVVVLRVVRGEIVRIEDHW